MSEEVYRPQKKQVQPQDTSAETNQAELNQMTQIRQQFNEEVGNKQQAPVEGIEVRGHVPEKFRQYLQTEDETPTQRGPKTRQAASNLRAQGSDKLEQLLAGLNPKTSDGSEYEEVMLPSRGRFYNGSDGPTNGVLHVKKMTGKEEEILATPRLVKKNLALNMIFDKCIQEKYKSENFLAEDRTYLLIYLRGISYSEIYDVEIKCPECDRTFSTEINLDEFMVDSCPDNFSMDSLNGTLPKSGYNFTYRLPRGSDEREIQSYKEFKSKGGFQTDSDAPDDSLHFRTALLVNDIEGLTEKNELKILIEKLPIGDVNYLRNTINNPPFGVDTKTLLECSACQAEFHTDLPLEASFFFPKDQKKNQTQV